ALAGASAPVAAGVESTTDGEAALAPSAVCLGVLLALLAICCAVTAAPSLTTARRRFAVGLAVVATVGSVLMRLAQSGDRLWWAVVWGAILLTCLALLSWAWPTRPRNWFLPVGALVVASAVLYAVGGLLLAVLLQSSGAPFTRLAGNAPVNSADVDLPNTFLGLAIGCLVVALWVVPVLVRDALAASARRRAAPEPATRRD
ncbi:MAG: hypothetical protein WCA46_07015, partial [Actinocatenispora sp.]